MIEYHQSYSYILDRIDRDIQMLSILLICFVIRSIDGIYQSNIQFSSSGLEYQPNNNLQLLETNLASTRIQCSATCNRLPTCQTLDYDTVSKRCRLFAGSLTSGSVISSSSATSLVGMVRITSMLFSSLYNRSCQLCEENRYQTCSRNSTTCRCPDRTYWTGSICALKVLVNEPCSQSDMCREDFNLTCGSECVGFSSKCIQSPMFSYGKSNLFHHEFNTFYLIEEGNSSYPLFGTTIVGVCNSSGHINDTLLNNQAGIALSNTNTFYTGDNSNRLLEFPLNSRTARALITFVNWPAFVHRNNRTSVIYISLLLANLVYIFPTNRTIPPNGIPATNCSMVSVNSPTGIATDSSGNVYISSMNCNWITKWAPNATSGTLIAGSPTGVAGWTAVLLYAPYGLALDEANSFIYVADRYNFRVQRFPLNGSGIGVTIAGDNGEGSDANQLHRPTDVYLSKFDGSLYIVDCFNSRIQKWAKNATSGITIAGHSNGTVGLTPYLLNKPYAFAFDDEERFMYVSDSLNNRIQRFRLQ